MIKYVFILFLSLNCFAQENIVELKNFGAENGLQGWTKQSDANFTTDNYSNPSVQNGKKYFVYSSVSSSNNLVFQNISVPNNYANQRCAISFNYRINPTFLANYYIKIRDITASVDLTSFETIYDVFPTDPQEWSTKVVEFLCPSAGNIIQIQFGDTSFVPAIFLHLDNILFTYKKIRTFYQGTISNGIAAISQTSTSYDPISSSNLTLNTFATDILENQGASTYGFGARITCQSGTASSGSTCVAVNENVGVSLILSAGTYNVCFKYTLQLGASDTAESDFRISRTTDTSATPVQLGNTLDYINDASGNLRTQSSTLCQAFSVRSTGRTAFRLLSRRIGATAISISQAGTIDITIQEVY